MEEGAAEPDNGGMELDENMQRQNGFGDKDKKWRVGVTE